MCRDQINHNKKTTKHDVQEVEKLSRGAGVPATLWRQRLNTGASAVQQHLLAFAGNCRNVPSWEGGLTKSVPYSGGKGKSEGQQEVRGQASL